MAVNGESQMEGPGVPGLARKLDHLFATIPQPSNRGSYTNDAVATELRRIGVTVTAVHVSNLRTGRRDNPSARLLAGLAEVFGVPIAYFFDPEREHAVNEQLAALAELRDAQVQGLMLRSDGLDATTVRHLIAALKQIRKMEADDEPGDS